MVAAWSPANACARYSTHSPFIPWRLCSSAISGSTPIAAIAELKAKEVIDRQSAALTAELDRLKIEHAQWQRRIALLKSDDIDPDMLDERARALLDYVDPDDLTLMYDAKMRPAAAPAP